MMTSIQNDRIESFLKIILTEENFEDISVKILGNSEKGDGYIGDIFFVHVVGKTKDQSLKQYNLILKCGKSSQALRTIFPIREMFECEMYLYEKVLPAFMKFQLEKNVETIFDSFPKCYGTTVKNDMEILVSENMKIMGYTLYDRKKPLNFNHIELVVKEFGKFHAISAAMADQNPKKFSELCGGIKNIWNKVSEKLYLMQLFKLPIDDVCELIKNDIDKKMIEKLQNLKSQIPYIMEELTHDRRYFGVIVHRDNWNNNFMFKYEGENIENPLKVVILDWQISEYTNPVVDLSYFIYCCISNENLDNFDDILKIYYGSFSSFVKKLGSNPDKIYPYSQLLEDWSMFAKFGLIAALLIIKIALTGKDEVSDIAESIEKGLDMRNTFTYETKDKTTLKNRILYLINHVVQRNLI